MERNFALFIHFSFYSLIVLIPSIRSGSSYYVQATGSPENSASWQDIVGPFTGNLLQTATETTTTESARYYRLRVTTP